MKPDTLFELRAETRQEAQLVALFRSLPLSGQKAVLRYFASLGSQSERTEPKRQDNPAE